MLERAGIKRPPDVVVAVTGDDEDNIVICQLARDRYGVEKTIARVNDPRNEPYFALLGISPTVSATASIMGLIEHEVPDHGLVRLLELRKENLDRAGPRTQACEGQDPACRERSRRLRVPGARLQRQRRRDRAGPRVGDHDDGRAAAAPLTLSSLPQGA